MGKLFIIVIYFFSVFNWRLIIGNRRDKSIENNRTSFMSQEPEVNELHYMRGQVSSYFRFLGGGLLAFGAIVFSPPTIVSGAVMVFGNEIVQTMFNSYVKPNDLNDFNAGENSIFMPAAFSLCTICAVGAMNYGQDILTYHHMF